MALSPFVSSFAVVVAWFVSLIQYAVIVTQLIVLVK
jgi:hypothetical protein